MKYQVRREAVDPFDLMCSDCQISYITYYEDTTEEELHSMHREELDMDEYLPEFQKQIMIEEGMWYPTEQNFKKWLWQSIKQGYIRIV